MLSRWIVFVVLSLCMFAYAYTYDIPVALQDQLQQEYNISNVKYSLFYSVYAWPNCVIPIIVGILTDKIGVNIIIIICFVVCVAGNALFVLGMYYATYPLMLVGRVIYGIGAESFIMAETPLIFEYFKGRELSFALGANISFSRVGSSVNDVTSYYFYDLHGLTYAGNMGLILLILCLILLSILILYRVLYNTKDLRFYSQEKDMQPQKKSSDYVQFQLDSHNNSGQAGYQSFTAADASIVSKDKSMALMDKSMMSAEQAGATENDTIKTIKKSTNEGYLTDPEEDQFKLSDIKEFEIRFWLVVVNTCLIYGCVLPWMAIGGSFMQSVYNYSHEKANLFLTIPYMTSGILTPFIGYGVDRLGYRCQLLLISTLLLVIVHYLFMEGDAIVSDGQGDYVVVLALLLMGVSYSIFCGVIWPAFAIVVHPKTLGTAYGIGVAGYNLFLGIFFIIVGILANEDDDEFDMDELDEHKYREAQYFLLSNALLSTFTVGMLWHFDKRRGNDLSMPTIQDKGILVEDNDKDSVVGLTKF